MLIVKNDLQTLPKPTLMEMQERRNSLELPHCSLSGSSPSPCGIEDGVGDGVVGDGGDVGEDGIGDGVGDGVVGDGGDVGEDGGGDEEPSKLMEGRVGTSSFSTALCTVITLRLPDAAGGEGSSWRGGREGGSSREALLAVSARATWCAAAR